MEKKFTEEIYKLFEKQVRNGEEFYYELQDGSIVPHSDLLLGIKAFISSLIKEERRKVVKEARYAIGTSEAFNKAHIQVLEQQIKELKTKLAKASKL